MQTKALKGREIMKNDTERKTGKDAERGIKGNKEDARKIWKRMQICKQDNKSKIREENKQIKKREIRKWKDRG